MTPTTTARMPSAPAKPVRESSTFEYTTYIATTPEKLWDALTMNELRKHWWRGHTVETDWNVGSAVTSRFPDGSPEFKGRVTESNRPRTLAFETEEIYGSEDYANERPNRVSFSIEGFGPLARLTLSNEATPKLIELARPGWPAVLSSLKSLLETGNPLPLDAVFGPEKSPGKHPTGLFVERTLEISAPATRVWKALTDPALTRQWIREFSPDFTLLESTWILGSPVLWKDNQNTAQVEGKVTLADPPRLLRFAVRDPTGRMDFLSEPDDGISYTLTEQGGRTTLAISHGDFGRDPGYRQYYEQSAATWDKVLRTVKRISEQP